MTDCCFNSMTCPGNPRSADHLTQSWEEGLQEEEKRAGWGGRIEEEEEERKLNFLSVQGPKQNLVLNSDSVSVFFPLHMLVMILTTQDMYGISNRRQPTVDWKNSVGGTFLYSFGFSEVSVGGSVLFLLSHCGYHCSWHFHSVQSTQLMQLQHFPSPFLVKTAVMKWLYYY